MGVIQRTRSGGACGGRFGSIHSASGPSHAASVLPLPVAECISPDSPSRYARQTSRWKSNARQPLSREPAFERLGADGSSRRRAVSSERQRLPFGRRRRRHAEHPRQRRRDVRHLDARVDAARLHPRRPVEEDRHVGVVGMRRPVGRRRGARAVHPVRLQHDLHVARQLAVPRLAHRLEERRARRGCRSRARRACTRPRLRARRAGSCAPLRRALARSTRFPRSARLLSTTPARRARAPTRPRRTLAAAPR